MNIWAATLVLKLEVTKTKAETSLVKEESVKYLNYL